MQIEIHGKPSISANGRKAQVTVLIGKGYNRRSVTRHAVRRGYAWVGNNPDERAIPLNARYEAELAEAKNKLSIAETALDVLKKTLDKANEVIQEVAVAIVKDELETAITTARANAMAADIAVDDAEKKLAQVQRELPLEVEFVGDDL